MKFPFLNIELINPFRRIGEEFRTVAIPQGVDNSPTPVNSGRSSVSEYAQLLQGGGANFGQITPKFRREFLELMEELSVWNGDVSNAVENIVKLANRPHIIIFSEDTPDSVIKKAQSHLSVVEKNWYRGGTTALKGDLLTQLAIFGALSAEAVIRNDKKGVEKICLVSHKHIVFSYDVKKDDFVPHQNLYNPKNKSNGTFMLNPLNPFTYKYYSLNRINENPYGIPPMLSALREIDIDDYLVDNLRFVAKKHGVLGFLSVLVNAPAKKQGENDESYWSRCQDYLLKIKPSVEDGYRNGISIGFKNSHDIKLQPTQSDGGGARDIIEINDQKKMSGLKQDPIFFGRPFNTSEAIGRVIFEKWTGQLEAYQNIVVAFLEDLYIKELTLAGINVSSLYVECEKPNTKDKLRAAQAKQLEIMNVISLRDEGIINQVQAAKELNYDKPAGPAPVKILKPVNNAPKPTP